MPDEDAKVACKEPPVIAPPCIHLTIAQAADFIVDTFDDNGSFVLLSFLFSLCQTLNAFIHLVATNTAIQGTKNLHQGS